MSDDRSHTDPDKSWESGWDDHERQQRERLANLSLAEKLEWLEEAHRLVRHLQRGAIPDDPQDKK